MSKKKQEPKEQLREKEAMVKKKEFVPKQVDSISLVRIMTTDIPGNKSVYVGLTRIKGISWAVSNAICISLGIDKNKKVSSLSPDEIAKINKFSGKELPVFLANRRFDRDTGESGHLFGSDLDIRKEFDIKRLKQIRSYRGLRHATGQPVRGQRTRSHFRKNKVVGVMKKAKVGKK